MLSGIFYDYFSFANNRFIYMIKIIRFESIFLLLFLGITALVSSVPLLMDPSGSIVGLPLWLLEHSPFESFLIPGIILFLFNGVSSIVVTVLVLRRNRHTPLLILYQGIVLVIWITVQLIMIRSTSYLHLIYGAVGLLLILSGLHLSVKRSIS